jgi:hypothetical protein
MLGRFKKRTRYQSKTGGMKSWFFLVVARYSNSKMAILIGIMMMILGVKAAAPPDGITSPL